MGLAPFGVPRYADVMRDRVIDIHPDGSVRLDQRYFGYRAGRRMTSRRLDELLGGPPRAAVHPLGEREADIAASAQAVLEEVLLRMATHANEVTGEKALCLAGGVALNCVANRRLLEEGPFEEIWIQPAAGDSGGSRGAALWCWHQVDGNPRRPPVPDGMAGGLLGPEFDAEVIAAWLATNGVPFESTARSATWWVMSPTLCVGDRSSAGSADVWSSALARSEIGRSWRTRGILR